MLTVIPDSDTLSLIPTVQSGILQQQLPDYVYSYPPRQTFRPGLELLGDDGLIAAAIQQRADDFNLYLHFPFCKQICGFCNLFAVTGQRSEQIDEYLGKLEDELRFYRSLIGPLHPRTVYFGGGTPTLLLSSQLGRVLECVESCFPGFRLDCEELAIEVAPETFDRQKATEIRSLGFTRVSLGAQTLDAGELSTLGRRHSVAVTMSAIHNALDVGFPDVCVDLINGLPQQSRSSWQRSVCEVIALHPPTVCTYNLTPRAKTGFAARTLGRPDTGELYTRYQMAQDLLLTAGYEQETSVRYVVPGRGGYRQKTRHWDGGVILGLGAGARTYTPRVHYDNGYSAFQRVGSFRSYLANVNSFGHSRTSGVLLDESERLRQRLILSGHKIEKSELLEIDKCLADLGVAELYLWLEDSGLVREIGPEYRFTPAGFMYRDIIAHSLFSSATRELVTSYEYA